MKKKNLIFEALAFLENYNPSPSMKGMPDSQLIYDIYIKNAVVSLLTVKKHNPDTDVALVINVDLAEKWKQLFRENSIIVLKCPFEHFKMSPDIVYSLSYYKLCAFKFVLQSTNYDRFCFLDCDTFGVKSFARIWEEADSAFLMIPNDSTIDSKIRNELIQIYAQLEGRIDRKIPHISSGFIAGIREDLLEVLMRCEAVYDELNKMNAVKPQGGDEVIWSLALADYPGRTYSPKAYCLLSSVGAREYWVDKADFEDENIIMWHLPAEKRYALIWAYNQFEKHGEFPSLKRMAKACRIRKVHSQFTVLSVMAILSDKTVIVRNVKKIWRRICGR